MSDWRVFIHCRRTALASNAPLPDYAKAVAVRRELQKRGDLTPVRGNGLGSIFLIDAPFASLLEVSEEHIIQEANPWAVFSHWTALAHHGLTNTLPRQIYATNFRGRPSWVPTGTTPEDWAELDFPSPSLPRRVREADVSWSDIKDGLLFGDQVGYNLGSPIYITDIERTLLDALRSPERSGGITEVFRAWRRAERLDLDRLVGYTDRFGNQTLRQRVGYLLQTLGLSHPGLDEWRRHLLRGGSVKLAAGEPYAETYSPEWNLSLNVPESVLAILREG